MLVGMDVLWVLLALAICIGLYVVAYRIEPHWVSKDGTRFMCTMQPVDRHDVPQGRIREVRGRFLADGVLRLDQKQPMRRTSAAWELVGRAPLQAKRRAVFTVRKVAPTDDATPTRIVLRLPADSALVARFDAQIESRKLANGSSN